MQKTPQHYFHLSKQLLIIALFFIVFKNSNAQNLVADSSFEYNSGTPTLLSSIGMNGAWSSPTRATTDLFCECHKKLQEISEAQVPRNPMGIQKANTGKCYAGIYAFSHGDYREYLFTQLMSPLRGGVKYELTFYISLADYARNTIDQIGACFLKGEVKYDNSEVITGLNPVYAKLTDEVGNDTVNWHQILIEYKAKGGEKYLLLGSFDVTDIEPTNVKAPKGVRTRINQKTERDAYYYIDDVSLRQYIPPYVAKFDTVVVPKIDTLKPTVVAVPTETVAEPALDKPMVLKNVLFETNAAVLLPSSFVELDATVANLYQNTSLKIEVHGYTDNVGKEIKNLKLSEKRAKAVADYLISKSIDPGRITHKGHGSQNPIADNSSEEGRKQNRRVELVFWK